MKRNDVKNPSHTHTHTSEEFDHVLFSKVKSRLAAAAVLVTATAGAAGLHEAKQLDLVFQCSFGSRV